MSTDRRRARILAMQALCQWEVQHDESPAALEDWLNEQGATPSTVRDATGLVQAVWRHHGGIDERIAAASRKWDLARISAVERNLMRVAVAEWIDGATPPKVVLNEAIEIGREYGGKDSPRFVNGVLDEVLKRMRQSPEECG